MLYSTSLLAFCAANAPRQLALYNTSTKQVIRKLNFSSPLHNIVLSRKILCVVLETWTFAYSTESLTLLASISCKSNPRGLVAVSQRAPLIALPGSPTTGIVEVHTVSDPRIDSAPMKFHAHKAALSYLVWSSEEYPLLATASLKGTTVRVWDRGEKKFTLRRGQSPARITCLTFVPDKKPPVLIVGSDHSTLHIWSLRTKEVKNPVSVVASHVLSAVAPSRTPVSRRGDKLTVLRLLAKPGPIIVAARNNAHSEDEVNYIIEILTTEGVLYSYELRGSEYQIEPLKASLLAERRIA